jgi:hypothetical protein
MEFGERIRSVLDEFDTRAAAAEIADVTPEHLASYIAGRAKPPFELVARLAAARNISLDWLATGDGPRSGGDAEPEGYVAVAVQMDAGDRYGEEADPPFLFSNAWLRTVTPAAVDKLRIVINRGTANDPVIRDGEAMLLDTTVTRICDDGLYVFPRDGKYLARFVETFVDRRVALKPRNPDYGTQMLSAEEAAKLAVFGRVCWRGGSI